MNWQEILNSNEQLMYVAVVHYERDGQSLCHAPDTSVLCPQDAVDNGLEYVREVLRGEPKKVELFVGGDDQVHIFDRGGFFLRSETAKLSPQHAAKEAERIATIDPYTLGVLSGDLYYFLSGGVVDFGDMPTLGMHARGFKIAKTEYGLDRDKAERFAVGWRDRMQILVYGDDATVNEVFRELSTARCGAVS